MTRPYGGGCSVEGGSNLLDNQQQERLFGMPNTRYLLKKMTAEEIFLSFPCSHITLLLSPGNYLNNLFTTVHASGGPDLP